MLVDLKDTPEIAKQIFNQLSEIFKEKSISPIPLNYYIWYCYIKRDNKKFSHAMDDALSGPFGYDDRLGKRLYEEFLTDEDDADNMFDLSLKRLINSIIQKMDTWSEQLSEQTSEISQAATTLTKNNLTQNELKDLTQTIVNTANSMQSATTNFYEDLYDSQSEISQLRKQLVEAKAEIMTDELTQVGNRKAFNHAMIEFTENSKDNPQNLSLIMTDIDFFKRINDNFGHLVGDSVLRYFTNIIKKQKQQNESVFRYGGEEFAILVTDSDKNSVIQRADEVRQNIQTAKLQLKGSTKRIGQITASFGVSTYKGELETIDDFIDRADKALYLAKNSGRNIVKSEDDL